MSGAAGLDWPGLMRAGLSGLRLLPREFWQLTPAELALMLGHGGAAMAMGRRRLEELSARWPDQPKTSDTGEASKRPEPRLG